MKYWTDTEVELLKYGAAHGIKYIASALPGRPLTAIFTKASKLGIKISKTMKYDRNGSELENKIWAWNNRILPILKENSGCLEWGKSHSNGYGQIRIYVNGRNRIFSTHRISWEVANNRLIDSGLNALHKCDNPKCNNHDHIFIGTDLDNGKDRHAKGRTRGKLFAKGQKPSENQVRGSRSPFAKLDDAKVLEARKIHSLGVIGHKLLARKYGVSPRTMYVALKGLSWAHVK